MTMIQLHFGGLVSRSIDKGDGMTSAKPILFTIGYQGRTQATMIETLLANGVTVLVDLREKPSSRIPGFSGKQLAVAVERVGIVYKAMGKNLGGLTCTWEQWEVGCNELARDNKGQVVAIMCMERDVAKCHRNGVAYLLHARHGYEIVHL